ncbi:MAG: PhoH family protein [Candidatus Omnitrophica bacterium]|nr:MAG: PhoH-like protein [Candidatus Hinthialibacteria bacterium OLB16]MBE7487335.1 PhoH family protein [bacterium]MBK7494018.1 PhoH family protein [Candidatus Omnitrophota bacterium]MCE7907224.1 PhoH family protein [Candidatus Omnitrophica bacterium COP1]MBV6480635.1 PhoH-like protein [bacterium]
MTEHTHLIRLNDSRESAVIYGNLDENLRVLEEEFEAHLIARGENLRIQGTAEQVDLVRQVIEGMRIHVQSQDPIDHKRLHELIRMVKDRSGPLVREVVEDSIQVNGHNRRVKPRTSGQKRYLDAIRTNDIVFGIGPAGTGKTYLAMACAVNALLNRKVKRIVLARPAVEAGESLGFLPGDLYEKVNPYLRPLYDALYDMMEFEKVGRMMQQGQIEVAPLAFMRGRTLNDCFVILDEAQNTTREQMKMFLTRLGYESKAVVTGDVTQIDLPHQKVSGLIDAVNVLKGISGMEMVWLGRGDVVRHRLVQEIIRAYEEAESPEGSHA